MNEHKGAVAQHADTIGELHRAAERNVAPQQHRIERLTAGLAQPRTMYFVLAFVAVWLGANASARALGLPPLDPPPYPLLSLVVSCAALFMTTIILVTEQRQSAVADDRARLELHLNLVADQRSAKLIQLLQELRKDLELRTRRDPEAEDLQNPVNAQEAHQTLQSTLREEPEASAVAEEMKRRPGS